MSVIPEPPDALAGLLSLALFKVREQEARIQELDRLLENSYERMRRMEARIQELEAVVETARVVADEWEKAEGIQYDSHDDLCNALARLDGGGSEDEDDDEGGKEAHSHRNR